MGDIAARLAGVVREIEAAAIRAGRDPKEVRLVAVTKTFPAEAVRDAVIAGAAIVGENRVQEALKKKEKLAGMLDAGRLPDWHLIGTLQKNKARQAVGEFELIHSLDCVPLAIEIDKRAGMLGIVQDVLIEVNIAGEASKHGVRPEEALGLAREVKKLHGLRLKGLMCIPPFTDDPEDSRPHYARLRTLLDEINGAGIAVDELSMGMTQDYAVAVEEGATLVRVGSAIFGERGK